MNPISLSYWKPKYSSTLGRNYVVREETAASEPGRSRPAPVSAADPPCKLGDFVNFLPCVFLHTMWRCVMRTLTWGRMNKTASDLQCKLDIWRCMACLSPSHPIWCSFSWWALVKKFYFLNSSIVSRFSRAPGCDLVKLLRPLVLCWTALWLGIREG